MSKPRFTLGDLLMWITLAGLVAALLAPMFGEGSRSGLVLKLAVSADGSTAAALFSDDKARVWNMDDGRRLTSLPMGVGSDIAPSADGKTLAASCLAATPTGYGIDLWDVATGKRVRTLTAHAGCQPVFAPGGGRLAWSSHSGSIEVYDPPLDSSPAVALAGPPIFFSPNTWTAPVFSPDGALLAARNGNDEIVVFDIASRKIQATLVAGPRFNSLYLLAPLKKMLFAERELCEQSAEPLMRLRAPILYRLLELCDRQFQQDWLTNGLVSALARDDGDDELAARLGRRMKAALLAGRVMEPRELFDRHTARTIRRVRRRGDRALHAWVIQYNTQAWSLVEFLCGRGSTPDRRSAFQKFWHDPTRRRSAAAALARQYGMNVDRLVADWRASIERQPPGEHQPPPPHLAAWMLREPLATVAEATALRRDRIVAVRILGELGFALGAERLIEVLHGGDPLLSEEAGWALECISGEVRGPSAAGWQAWWQSLPDAARNGAAATATSPVIAV
ncbi:MAG TPA: hypothetical protein VNH11_13370 [Pirellulales bacterium]|nr:hypothetical protein [Pirellulales bacterium]